MLFITENSVKLFCLPRFCFFNEENAGSLIGLLSENHVFPNHLPFFSSKQMNRLESSTYLKRPLIENKVAKLNKERQWIIFSIKIIQIQAHRANRRMINQC